MRIFVATFGYEWSHVIAIFSYFKGCTKDVIYLITPDELDEKALNAINQVKLVLKQLSNFENVIVYKVRSKSFIDCIYDISKFFKEILSKCESTEFIIDLGGGLRILVISVLFVLLLLISLDMINHNNVHIVTFHEGKREVISIKGTIFKMLANFKRLTSERYEILKKLNDLISVNDEVSVRDLSYELGKDSSTVKKHCEVLEELGLVKLIRPERSVNVSKTELTSLAILLKELGY